VTQDPDRAPRRGQLLAALVDIASEPIFALDEDGTIVYVNSAAATEVGRLRRHLLGKPFIALLALEGRRALRHVLGDPQLRQVELELDFSEGGRRAVAVRALPRIEPRILAVTILSANASLPPPPPPPPPPPNDGSAVVGRTLNRLFLRFPFGAVGIAADGRVVFVNPQARALLDDSRIRVGGILVPPEPLAGITQRLLRVPATSLVQTVDLEGRTVRVVGVGASGLHPAVLILEDATKTRRQTDVMRDFVRNAAHQLRTPLTGIAAAIEVLQSGAKDDPVERDRFLSHIDTHARRLIRIARGLLVLARAESGEQSHEDVVVLLPLLQELAREARPAAGVEVSVECDPTLDAIADPDLVYEALAALVDNAVEHTRDGTIRLQAGAANGTVSISVTDTAGGILPEHKERIFEPFYRPIAGAKGFGLGLAIAAQAVNAMGGELGVDDTDGGSRFTVRLRSGSRSR
jgi:two-component system phosphate regulon sensor histidine kinase PhoR